MVLEGKEDSVMSDWRRSRRLPPDIQLEVEMLIRDLRGENSPPLRRSAEAGAEAARELSRREHGADFSRFPGLRRFTGAPRANESQ